MLFRVGIRLIEREPRLAAKSRAQTSLAELLQALALALTRLGHKELSTLRPLTWRGGGRPSSNGKAEWGEKHRLE